MEVSCKKEESSKRNFVCVCWPKSFLSFRLCVRLHLDSDYRGGYTQVALRCIISNAIIMQPPVIKSVGRPGASWLTNQQ